ncbi:MAG: sialate O-acetylesterase [Bacteroidales bacterium]|nr:sialate O-acetylesterase [Bacteroidales bacterium]
MKRISFAIVAVLVVAFQACQTRGNEYHLYYLGGQSNMDGYGLTADLPASLAGDMQGVMIYHGNTSADNTPVDGRGIWSTLRPGHGAGFKSDGTTNLYSDRFGVELSFAEKMKELFPDEKIAIIKYSRGGTSIDTAAAGGAGAWLPGYTGGNAVNQYDHFLSTVKGALAAKDIDGDGKKDRLLPSGILWMQGESDANNDYATSIYKENLAMLIDSIRTVFSAPDMPVAIGRISDSRNDADSLVWTWGDAVREAQAKYVAEDGKAVLVTSTDNYGYSDPWHYDSEGYIDLGRKFAEAIAAIRQR